VENFWKEKLAAKNLKGIVDLTPVEAP